MREDRRKAVFIVERLIDELGANQVTGEQVMRATLGMTQILASELSAARGKIKELGRQAFGALISACTDLFEGRAQAETLFFN